ncbi:MAG: hypothetical protein U0637_14635 [Phycisphaerales bacterium]
MPPPQPPPPAPPVSRRQGHQIEPVDPGGLSAIIAYGTPTPELWEAASRTGGLVVRSAAGGDAPAWMPAPRRAWDDCAAALSQEAARRNVDLLLWPHAEDVVSDLPGIVQFFRSGPGSLTRPGADPGSAKSNVWSLLLDPAALLTPAMLADADDHVSRMAEAARSLDVLQGAVKALLVRERQVGGGFAPVAPESAWAGVLQRAWRAALRDVSPRLVLEGDVESQRALLIG